MRDKIRHEGRDRSGVFPPAATGPVREPGRPPPRRPLVLATPPPALHFLEMQTRREFLGTLGIATVGAAVLGCTRTNGQASVPPSTMPIGIQLYTLRSVLAKDFDGTLARVAEIGYKEVEFAGYYDRTPAQIREVLQRTGFARRRPTSRSRPPTTTGSAPSTPRGSSATSGPCSPGSTRTSARISPGSPTGSTTSPA